MLLLLIGWMANGSPLFKQVRVGMYQKPFFIVKFRTMKVGTPSLATHLIDSSVITPFGYFLRLTKLDELPQLWNVLLGEMSFVGPRPCLFNQEELVLQRFKRGVFNVRPGITGLAQIQGINMLTPELLAKVDAKMIASLSIRHYFFYIFITMTRKNFRNKILQ
jgi:lipopolysaccharide/colanic/teichoic acid biosynthesis glycosyltransferase